MKYSFGVIICTYNRCESLKDALESLSRQECDWSLVAEIIIVDNNSTDGTKKLIHSYADSFKTKLKYFKEEKQGKSHALNLGITSSQSDVLVFTDDDVILDSQWLGEIIRFFNENEVDVLGGRVLPLYPSQTPQWVKENQQYLRGPIVYYDYGEDIIDFNSGKICSFIGANVVFKRKVFDATGLFNVNIGPGQGTLSEDIEMFVRALKKGKKMIYDGKALVMHPVDPHRMTLRYIAKWNFQQGKTNAIFEAIENENKLPCFGRVPRYLLRSIILKFFKFFLVILRPRSFLSQWCAFYFNLGMITGYISK
jgi:glycosyltransferase involved in cell wall biosynthesis